MSHLSSPQVFDFSGLSSEAIVELLKANQIRLTAEEALTIQNQFLKRPPTLAECILWSIQGSEHCSYKSTRTHLQTFHTQGPHVLLGPKEDAGIVEIARDAAGRRYGLVISHESHNHPSQIVPYEGAATGVGGNIRDVCCMGAEVVAIADSLRFGDVELSKTLGIAEGVIKGIGGYGNPIGIPTIAGDLYFDPGYNENCLVTVVTLGIIREDHIIHSYTPPGVSDYVFILVGKPTDNSGFGGASFASTNLSSEEHEANKGAVQEPNAFLQRHLLKANYAMFKWLQEENLLTKVGFKDLGAGGIACASVELADASGYGAEVFLHQVPTSLDALQAAVVLCAETQERFMWVVPEHLAQRFLDHYNKQFALPQVSEGACAAVIGRIREDGQYIVHYHDQVLVNARAADITRGILYERPTARQASNLNEPKPAEELDYNAIFLSLLAHENIASRTPVFETYDKQVQGRTLIEAGCADAGVLQVFNEDTYPAEIRATGVALSIDHNPRYCQIDAYWGAVNAVCESVRNVTAVGAQPLALTDCLCFGNPERPEEMQVFVDAVQGIKDACRAIKLAAYPEHTLPIVSGNVSLYNESANQAIPPSPIISCVGKISDVRTVCQSDFKAAGHLILLVGERKDECGGSVYYALQNALGSQLPRPNLQTFNAEIQSVQSAIAAGLILACHDISEGGIAVALAEMSFTNEVGFSVNIPGDLPADKRFFSETGGFLLEVAKSAFFAVQAHFKRFDVPFYTLGETTESKCIEIDGVINVPLAIAKQQWLQGLRERLN